MASSASGRIGLRKPAPDLDSNRRDQPAESRSISPSRLPVKPLTSATALPTTKAPLLRRGPSVKRPQTAGGASSSSSSGGLTFSQPTGLPSANRAIPRTQGTAGKPSGIAIPNDPGIRPPSQASAGTTTTRAGPRPTSITALHRRQPSTTPLPAPSAPHHRRQLSNNPRPVLVPGPGPDAPPTAPLLPRPAFTTHQQHFSPLKSLAPRPLTSALLAPPSPSKLPSNIALSADTARQQTDLLHLHLLHCPARPNLTAWHASAADRLGARFTALSARHAALAREEAARAERTNAAALARWGAAAGAGGVGAAGLEARVQALDAVLAGVWALGEPGGRYARVVRKFERWAERVAAQTEARRGGGAADDGLGGGGGGAAEEEGESEPAWRDEWAGLVTRLDAWRRQLVELELRGAAVDGEEERGAGAGELSSSLARVLRDCRSLVHDMLAELDLMEQMERGVRAREREWIQESIVANDDDDAPRAGAIWRSL